MKYILAALVITTASPALAVPCAPVYTQVMVPVCAPVAGGITAIPANSFLNSLGANIHHSQGYPEAPYEAEFTYTGIRNARDFYVSSSFVTLHNNTLWHIARREDGHLGGRAFNDCVGGNRPRCRRCVFIG